ncbi:MAG: hypothetical protein KF817_06330 [Phycisphaeraceae bacterium]|nr:hypothetical protein [Phycisphaeraceae bacterium]
MKRETLVWTIVFVIGGVMLLANAFLRGAGNQYVRVDERAFVNVGTDDDPKWVNAGSDDILDHDAATISADRRVSWKTSSTVDARVWAEAERADPGQRTIVFSLSRTVGTWLAALFTLAILSFLYRDNPFYKSAESIIVGVSAAYWMVVGFWDTLVPILFANIVPELVKGTVMPGISDSPAMDARIKALVALVLGALLLCRLLPKGGWISRWPMAFIIGAFCGLRLIAFLHADFLSQISNSIIPLWVVDPATQTFDIWSSLENITLIAGVLACLVYFFFSIEHKGVVGRTARVGIWFLMITFGAAFGYTVMGRIALLAMRLEFLFEDWLWLVDPAGRHAIG